jgi:hypothetical protein
MHAESFAKGAAGMILQYAILTCVSLADSLVQRYSTFFVHVPPDTISLQPCTPKLVGV